MRVGIEEDLAVIVAILAVSFLCITFVRKLEEWSKLLIILSDFRQFGKPDGIELLDGKLNLLAKMAYVCLFITISTYGMTPVIERPKCYEYNREHNLTEWCGYYCPIWFPIDIDFSPVKELVWLFQLCACYTVFIPAAMISLFIYEVNEHFILRVKQLKDQAKRMLRGSGDAKTQLGYFVKYHQHLIG